MQCFSLFLVKLLENLSEDGSHILLGFWPSPSPIVVFERATLDSLSSDIEDD